MTRLLPLVVALLWLSDCSRRPDVSHLANEMARLAGAQGRFTAGRIAGATYSPQRSATRGLDDKLHTDHFQVLQLAALIQAEAARDPNAENLRALGAGYLLLGDSTRAVQVLEDSVAQAASFEALNDLAVAYLELGAAERPDLLPRALDVADRSVRLRPAQPEARFNLALALESLHLETQALNQWEELLRIERSDAWRGEVAQRMALLSRSIALQSLRSGLADRIRQVALGPQKVLEILASEPDADARDTLSGIWLERVLLARWAEEVQRGRLAGARLLLATARTVLGADFGGTSGDELRLTVAAYSQASGGRLQIAARAHANYVGGLDALDADDLETAAVRFGDAIELFTSARVPLRSWADLHMASVEYSRGAYVSCRRRLGIVLQAATQRGSHRLTASVRRSIAMVDLVEHDYSHALTELQSALDSARRAGDGPLTGRTLNNLADTLDVVGRRRESWKARVAALDLAAKSASVRLAASVYGSTGLAASREQHYAAALAFVEAQQATEQSSAPILRFMLESRRATLQLERGDIPGVRESLARADRFLESLRADARAETLTTAIAPARAELLARTQGVDAGIAVLDEALASLKDRVPSRAAGLRLRRARLLATKGEIETAVRELGGAIQLFEQASNSSLGEVLEASTTRELVKVSGELITALLERDENAPRALEIWSSVQRALNGDHTRQNAILAPRTALLQYAVLHDRVVAWLTVNERIHTRSIALPALVRAKVRLDTAVVQGARFNELDKAFEELHELLVRPFASALHDAERLVVVPDGMLSALPFGSLRDPAVGSYLFDTFLVEMAWSVPAGAPAAEPGSPKNVLVVADPGTPGQRTTASLAHARAEGEVIARMYPSSRLLAGERATGDAALTEFSSADIVHWAGHAVMNETDGRRSYLAVAPQGEGRDRLTADDIGGAHVRAGSTVILAACRSVDAPYRAFHARSLGHAFHRAGAQYVIGVAWDIPDAGSRRFFEALHQELAQGFPAPVALRTVQRRLVRDTAVTAVALAAAAYVK